MDSSLFLILSTVPKVGLLESVYVCKHMLVCVHAYMYVATQEGEYCINNNNNALSCVLLCIAGEEFPGLFTWSVPVHTWLSDSIHLVLNTFWGSRSEVVVVSLGHCAQLPLPPTNRCRTGGLDEIAATFSLSPYVRRSPATVTSHNICNKLRQGTPTLLPLPSSP